MTMEVDDLGWIKFKVVSYVNYGDLENIQMVGEIF